MSEHVFMLDQDFATGVFNACCTCGWESSGPPIGQYTTGAEALAVDRWEDHCDVVFMEATETTAWREGAERG